METVLEECGHTILKKCNDEQPTCSYKCFYRLMCSHVCEKNCHMNDDPEHEVVDFVFKKCFMIDRL